MFLFYLPAFEFSILLIQHGDLKADKETSSVGLPMFPSTGYELKKSNNFDNFKPSQSFKEAGNFIIRLRFGDTLL